MCVTNGSALEHHAANNPWNPKCSVWQTDNPAAGIPDNPGFRVMQQPAGIIRSLDIIIFHIDSVWFRLVL